ncbi:MAG: hypothetical protein ACM3JJ_03255 [Hyphomicrobiales bacterium]
MVRASALAHRIRIAAPEDLSDLEPPGHCLVDPWASSRFDVRRFELLCRTLGATLNTVVEGHEPLPEDGRPEILRRLLGALRDDGYDVWAVRMDLGSCATDTIGAEPEVPRPPIERRIQTRFFVTPATLPRELEPRQLPFGRSHPDGGGTSITGPEAR